MYNDGSWEILDICDSEGEARREASAYLRRWYNGDQGHCVVCFSTTVDPDSIEDFNDLRGNKTKMWHLYGDEV